MKRRVFAAILFCMALITYSCSRELEQPAPVVGENMQEITISAHLEDNAFTRTSVHYENGAYTLFWEPGDKISLFFGSGTDGGEEFTARNTQEEQVTSFRGLIWNVTLGVEGITMPDIYFWGVYPFSYDNVCDGSTVTTTLPNVQTARAGSFDKELYIAMGKSLGLNIGFLCACSGIRFRVTHPGIRQIIFSGNNGEVLAGTVKLGFGSDGKPQVMEVLDGKKSIMLNAPDGTTFQPGTDYYIVTLPTQFTASMKMEFIQMDGTTASRRWQANDIELKRNIIKEYVNTPIDDDQFATFMETVDLGLPSGTLWAACNLGATSPEEAGNYYAWGEVTPRTGNYGTANSTITDKYQDPSHSKLQSVDDAANYLMGGDWRLPTKTQIQELIDECTWSQSTQNGVSGFTVTGTNGNSIFIPVAGRIPSGRTPIGNDQAFLWSSTKPENKASAHMLHFSGELSPKVREATLGQGFSIRPVRKKTNYINFHEFVEMGDGLKWATMNVGAFKPEEYGDYFAWGEIAPKWNYERSTYFEDLLNLWYYAPDKMTQLDLSDDAARANWGGTWRMPTAAEWTWLLENCTWDYVRNYDGTGKNGMVVTSKVSGFEGNSFFLPAAGFFEYSWNRNSGWNMHYWSSSLDLDPTYYFFWTYYGLNALSLYANDEGPKLNSFERDYGASVRPVSD